MTTTVKVPIEIYTESTPNPETMKFVLNRMMLKGQSAEFVDLTETKEAPFAAELIRLPNIKNVFIANNFVTLAKSTEADWMEIIPELKQFIKNYVNDGRPFFTSNFKPASASTSNEVNSDDSDIIKRIKQMLEQHVKPAVEMDGGAIQFKSFENGKLTLVLQGACSGCPSSTITLKAGIEGMMKKMIPGVEEVVAENE